MTTQHGEPPRIIFSNDHLISRIVWQPPLVFEPIGRLHPLLQEFFMRKKMVFSAELFDWSQTTPFQFTVLRRLLTVPPGKVTTYGELAAAAGSPAAARAAGSAVANNPFPFLVPCHRVLPADLTGGSYAGVKNSADKIRLLELEQVPLLKTKHGKLRAAETARHRFK